MKRLLIALASLIVHAGAAHADWFYQMEDNPFEGDQHIAMAAEFSGYMTAFRCSGPKDLKLLFVTPEKAEGDTLALLRNAPHTLLVVVDSEDKIELDAQLETTPDGTQYRWAAEGPQVIKVVFDAAKSKRRFAVAQEFMGKVGHSKTFSSGGSTRVLKKLIEGCNLAEPAIDRAPKPGEASATFAGLSELYWQFVGFRDEPLFKKRGFGLDRYRNWMEAVEAVGRNAEVETKLIAACELYPNQLVSLASTYFDSKPPPWQSDMDAKWRKCFEISSASE